MNFFPLYSLLNPLNAKLNPICHLLALLRAHHILHVGRITVEQIIDPIYESVLSSFKTLF